MTRQHEPTVTALARRNGDTWSLESPSPGYFFPGVTDGDLVIAGHAIGELGSSEDFGHAVRAD